MGNLHMKARLLARSIRSNRNWFPIEAWDDIHYDQAFRRLRTQPDDLQAQRVAAQNAIGPLFSIVVPLYKTPNDYLEDMVESVLAQTYPRFELILVNASPDLADLSTRIAAYASQDSRIKTVELEENLGITENTNAGIAAATGDFLCFIDHDDWIEPDTLFEYAAAIAEHADVDMLYCDEDLAEKVRGEWRFVHPLFKQDFSPELLLSKNYIIHFLAVRKSIVDGMAAPGSVFDGAQDYNMTLAVSERARRVSHVAKVLYHFRMSDASTAANPAAKPYRMRAARLALQNHLERTGGHGRILGSKVSGTHTVWFLPEARPKVSVVVMGSEGATGESFGVFIETFSQVNTYDNIEIVCVGKARQFTGWEPDDNRVRTVVADESAGLYAQFNAGAHAATGEILVFLDADCAFVTPEPIEQLVGLHSREGVGAVAPKQLFADYTLKSYGVGVSGEGIVPLYRGYTLDYPSYLSCLYAHQNASAVEYRGLMIQRELFESIGGFDESYDGELGSVDLCHRLLADGKRIALSCHVELLTGESSPVRPFAECDALPDYPAEGVNRFYDKWPAARTQTDPYRNPRLNLKSSYPTMNSLQSA